MFKQAVWLLEFSMRNPLSLGVEAFWFGVVYETGNKVRSSLTLQFLDYEQ